MLNVVVLVGGLGSRLRPLSYALPKPLMPIAGRPALEHLLEKLPQGPVWLAAAYGYEHFEAFAKRFPQVRLVREETLLGTGGAIAQLSSQLSDEIMVVNGDTFVDFAAEQFLEEHRRSRAFASILGVQVDDVSRYGELLVENHWLLEFREKSASQARPGLINAGVYLLSQAPQYQPCSLERDCFPAWLREGRLIRVHPCQGEFLDIGTPDAYLEAQERAMNGRLGITLGPWKWPGQAVWVGPGAELGPEVKLLGPVVIGAGARVGAGTRLRRCVLWDGACVGRDCDLTDSVLASGVAIPDGTVQRGLLKIKDGLERPEKKKDGYIN